ncbi:MAG: ribosome maturation factor RimP [Candidatus Hydrogenedentes bacterium]|nr:ribosome maturation factor RimP [Candidatus Hydrogenedentota bacterium]
MSKEELIRRFWSVFESEVVEQGYELVDVELTGVGGVRILRIYIDKETGGIVHQDCTAVSQLLNPLLDADNFISDNYILEVSSPGIDRPVRKPKDFERFAGESITVTTLSPVLGQKEFIGVLRGFGDGLIQVDCEGTVFEIHLENLRKANLNR